MSGVVDVGRDVTLQSGHLLGQVRSDLRRQFLDRCQKTRDRGQPGEDGWARKSKNTMIGPRGLIFSREGLPRAQPLSPRDLRCQILFRAADVLS